MTSCAKPIVLEDIDHVLFPFREQYAKFFTERYGFNEEIVKPFFETNHKYLNDYLIEEDSKQKYPLTDLLEEQHPEILISNPFKDDFIQKVFIHSLGEFGNSKYFTEGCYAELVSMNREMLQQCPETIVIAVSSRGLPQNPNNLYDDCIDKIWRWNKTENVGLNELYFFRSRDKHQTIDLILKKHQVSKRDIAFMIDDTPAALEGFLSNGITCILRAYDNPQDIYHKNELKKAYNGQLLIAKTPAEAAEMGLELFRKHLEKD